MNALLKESRSIVTDIPCTTRDTIEEVLNIKGIPIILIDTAGIIDTRHPIEKEGIKRSHLAIEASDLLLFVLDYGRKLKKTDMDIMRRIKNKDNTIIVINKKDLKKSIELGVIKRFFPNNSIMYTSALNSSGIGGLENRIYDIIFAGKVPSSDFLTISNDRQVDKLQRSLEDIKLGIDSYRDKVPMECISVCVKSAIEDMGELTGHTIAEDALDRIFSEFCIGK